MRTGTVLCCCRGAERGKCVARSGRPRSQTGTWVVVLAVAAFGSLRLGGWGCLLVTVASAAAIWWLVGRKPERAHESTNVLLGPDRLAQMDSADDEFVTVRVSDRKVSEFKVPPPPRGYGNARWLGLGESIEVQGIRLPGGLFYVGTSLVAPNRDVDPCLIDPTKKLSASADFTLRQTDYWPGYSTISPAARRAYLQWLADGRRHPDADIGYVFLFFYGLERRVLIDGRNDVAAQRDFPLIAQELRRLLGLYGASKSFRFYAGALLNWVELARPPPRLYANPVPEFPAAFEVPFYIRVALGQASVDRSPIPAPLALAWIKSEPSTRLRTAAKRCAPEFDRLFERKYLGTFGAGLVVAANRTKLKFYYRPASAGLLGGGDFSAVFGELPDVTAVTSPITKLQAVVDETTAEIEPYSRLVGRQPTAASSLDGLALLPGTLWPEPALASLRTIRARMKDGLVRMPCSEFLGYFSAKVMPPRARFTGFARALESQGLGIEPDVLGRARAPKLAESIVVFEMLPSELALTRSAPFLVAELTLQLASAVATTDGSFGHEEVRYLRNQIGSWHHLLPNQQRRLLAQLAILEVEPESTTGMKKRLDPLDQATRETIASIIVNLAQSDGHVSPEEVRTLEKAYRLLGVDAKRLFSDLHGAASRSDGQPPRATPPMNTGIKLDQDRIARLQNDTNRVSAMLADIFAEPELPEVAPEQVDREAGEEREEPPTDSILGLDGPSSAFARMVLSRPRWTRADLQDVAIDMELMLDGALERINEASFEKFDLALTEGDDPVEVNAEVVEKLET